MQDFLVDLIHEKEINKDYLIHSYNLNYNTVWFIHICLFCNETLICY